MVSSVLYSYRHCTELLCLYCLQCAEFLDELGRVNVSIFFEKFVILRVCGTFEIQRVVFVLLVVYVSKFVQKFQNRLVVVLKLLLEVFDGR